MNICLDIIILLFDANKLDISDEFRRAIKSIHGYEDKVNILIYFNIHRGVSRIFSSEVDTFFCTDLGRLIVGLGMFLSGAEKCPCPPIKCFCPRGIIDKRGERKSYYMTTLSIRHILFQNATGAYLQGAYAPH